MSPQTVEAAAEDALERLVALLREEEKVLSARVVEPGAEPVIGTLTARGPRAASAPGEYALVAEAVLEGYLLHYGESRLLAPGDADLALLAGDYLYAQGIERLSRLGDSAAVRELADLISLAAEARAEGREDLHAPLWLAAAIAVGCGTSEALEAAKSRARALEPDAARALMAAARGRAAEFGLTGPLDRAADSIHFPLPDPDANG